MSDKIVNHFVLADGSVARYSAEHLVGDVPEVVGIRTGYDGTEYANAGDAVRAQAFRPVYNASPATSEPIKGFYVHDEATNTDGVAKVSFDHLAGVPLLSGNMFGFDGVSYNKALNTSDGTETDSTGLLTSDFIYVGDVQIVYLSDRAARYAKYDDAFNFIEGGTNAPTTFALVNHGVQPAYIRLTLTNAIAQTFIISKNSTLVNKYGYYPKAGLSGVNCDKDISAYNYRNSASNVEKLSNFSVLWVGCSGNYDYSLTYGEEKSVYAINNVGTTIDLRLTPATAVTATGIAKIILTVYIPDASLINSLTFSLLGTNWSRVKTDFVNGWNTLEFYTFDGVVSSWDTITGLRLYFAGTIGLSLYFAKCEFIRPEKANLIFVQDGGYSSFLDVAYPLLKEIDVPVTWALTPGRLGQSAGAAGHVLTQEEIDTIATDYCSEFSFHSWAADRTSDMTAEELKDDAGKCINYLRRQGLAPSHVWRAAHTQNNAPEYEAEIGLVEALATGTAKTGHTVFPFPNRYNIPRTQVHERDESWFTTQLDVMKKTHSTMVWYAHGVSNAPTDISAAMLDVMVDKLTTAMSEGWLNATTYDMLRNAEG